MDVPPLHFCYLGETVNYLREPFFQVTAHYPYLAVENFDCLFQRWIDGFGRPRTSAQRPAYRSQKISLAHARSKIHFRNLVLATGTIRPARFRGTSEGVMKAGLWTGSTATEAANERCQCCLC